jgi:hypothetical protein
MEENRHESTLDFIPKFASEPIQLGKAADYLLRG